MRAQAFAMMPAVALALTCSALEPAQAQRAAVAKPNRASKARPRRAKPARQRQRLQNRLGGGMTQLARPGLYETGLPTALLSLRANPGAWGRQRMSQWCWAATSQMVLNYHGVPVHQEAVITRAYGGYLDRPASVGEIARTLSGWVVPRGHGRAVVAAQAYEHGLTTATVLRDLHAGKPLIIGLVNRNGQGGHAYVLTSVRWGQDLAGNPVAVSAKLRDPWPGNPSSIELSWAELSQRFSGAVRIDTAAMP